jgi:chemotaxis methyl-accepting protein methylase
MELTLNEPDMKELARLVNSRYGVNLSMYRSTCMRRRIMHRLNMVGCDSIEEYFMFIGSNPEEIEKLMDIITIHVTGFFRDKDVFSNLERTVLPAMISAKEESRQSSIRVWSAGCSTGEETYSLAILLNHLVRRSGSGLAMEVFGTDLSEESCKTARSGLYSAEKIEEVPSQMKSEAFEPEGSLYRISPAIRKKVRFIVHNLFSPSPFSMLDLIVCRNVLIHFEPDGRGRINKYFYESLRDDGLLMLGKSEALGSDALDLFELVHPRSKIYRKNVESNVKED